MVYFFDKAHMSSGSFYSAYTFLNDTSPYLWSSTIECVISKNSHYGAKKYGHQLAQPPKTITVTAVLYHCIHFTEMQRAGLHSYIRIYNQLFHATAELIRAYAENKAQLGETWLIEASVEAVAPPVVSL